MNLIGYIVIELGSVPNFKINRSSIISFLNIIQIVYHNLDKYLMYNFNNNENLAAILNSVNKVNEILTST